MKRPVESDYTSHVAYTRALEGYCDALEQQYMTNAAGELEPVTLVQTGVGIEKPEQKAKPITADEMSAWVEDTWKKCQAEAWRERKPLTDEEIGLLTTGDDWAHLETPALAKFARAIEAAHGIREEA